MKTDCFICGNLASESYEEDNKRYSERGNACKICSKIATMNATVHKSA